MRFPGQAVVMVLGLLLAFSGSTALAQGQPYRSLDTPLPTQGSGVEVREFFSYACPHCADFEPRMSDWAAGMGDRITLVKTPVTFGRDSWELLARAFHTAEVLAVVDQTHGAMYEAIHDQGRSFEDREAIAEFYAEVTDFTAEEVLDAMRSFSVETALNRSQRAVDAFAIPGTPSVAVAGQHLIDIRAAGGQAGMLEVAESLVAEEAAR